MNYDLKAAIERVKNAPWFEVLEPDYSFQQNSVNAGIEVYDYGSGELNVECSLYAKGKLGTGASFEEAFADLESKTVEKKPRIVQGDISASV